MTPQSQDRLQRVGRRVLAARKRLKLNRVELAKAASLSDKSVARLESGQEVRLSTYLAVVDYLETRGPSIAGLMDRVAVLPDRGRALVLEVVTQLERNQQP